MILPFLVPFWILPAREGWHLNGPARARRNANANTAPSGAVFAYYECTDPVYGLACRGVSALTVHGIDTITQFLAGLEVWNELATHLDPVTRLWIASDTRRSPAQ